MPYSKNSDLPSRIKNHLPIEAQTIFRKTFNAAHKKYTEEERVFKIAWTAVKNVYEKNDSSEWIKKKK